MARILVHEYMRGHVMVTCSRGRRGGGGGGASSPEAEAKAASPYKTESKRLAEEKVKAPKLPSQQAAVARRLERGAKPLPAPKAPPNVSGAQGRSPWIFFDFPRTFQRRYYCKN